VTELADEIVIRIRLLPDRSEVSYTTNIEKLRVLARGYVSAVAAILTRPAQKGSMSLEGGCIEIEWSNTGLHEIPEENGGDN
jgi:hypothetical protein